MRQIKFTFLTIFLIALPILLGACSSDDKESPLSKEIKRVDVYKGLEENGRISYELLSSVHFSYENNRLVKMIINKENPVSQITYIYDPDNATFLRMQDQTYANYELNLENNKLKRLENIVSQEVFRFNYNGNYLQSTSVRNLDIEYAWRDGSLSTIKCQQDLLLNKTYLATSILNNYSLDLNIFGHFIEDKEDYVETMNTFAQVAGLLGSKSFYLLEDGFYQYDYLYDGNMRLSKIEMVKKSTSPTLKDSFFFRINYKD